MLFVLYSAGPNPGLVLAFSAFVFVVYRNNLIRKEPMMTRLLILLALLSSLSGCGAKVHIYQLREEDQYV